MRIVAAPNAFKGSLTAMEAAEAIKRGALVADPGCEVLCAPVADGGDGLTEVLVQALAGVIVPCDVSGPLMERQPSLFGYVESRATAVIEMARASGLSLLPRELQDPTETTSYGTGELIGAALAAGAKRVVLGLGGSATCDGGTGMAAALGYRFLDKEGKEVAPVGRSLVDIHSIDASGVDRRLADLAVEAVCDVSNPLTGPDGAAYVYSPQKGATPEQVKFLDEGLENLADVVLRERGLDIRTLPGAGAAGGLGGGVYAFLGAKLRRGIDLVIDAIGLEEKVRGADLVITGEGQVDFQTKFDKAPAGVARVAKKEGIPCIAVCGAVGERIDELYDVGISAVFSLCRGPQSLESAMADSGQLLAHGVEQVVRTFLAGRKAG